MVYIVDTELYHYGLKGMKWGHRRWQNGDGTFNEAGKERYFGERSSHRPPSVKQLQNDPDVQKSQNSYKKAQNDYQEARAAYYKATKNGLVSDAEATKKLIKASNNVGYAKEDLKDTKTRKRMEADTRTKSKRRLKLEEDYKSKGMTQKEAELAAYKRERTEKALKIAAGVAVGVAVAYGAKKYAEENFDKVLDVNTTMKRVATSDTAAVQDAFYATMGNKKMDNAKYAGFYANQLKEGVYGQKAEHVYEKTIKATGQIKMASAKNARSALQELLDNDPDFKKEFNNMAKFNPAMRNAVSTGKIDKQAYDYFNRQLGAEAKNTELAKKYYDSLSNKGYNAIMDINDKKYSGFGTDMPVIVFNAKDKVSVDKVRELGTSEIKRKNALATMDIGAKQLAPVIGVYGGMGVGVAALSKTSKNNREQKIVAEYKKEHPNTKLSYKEIVRNYYDNN